MENQIIEDSDDDLAEIEETIINLKFSWLIELFSNRKMIFLPNKGLMTVIRQFFHLARIIK